MIEIVKADRQRAVAPERPDYFSGTVRLQYLTRPADLGKAELIAVFFEAGARTIPPHPLHRSGAVRRGG